jgi:hypothetical protein
MVNMAPAEFWAKALEVDPESHKPVNKALYYAAMGIERNPLHGPGSNGGGRICVCENCGIAEWTHTKTKQFCSRKCKNEYYADPKTAKNNPNAKRRGKVHKTCSFCGREFSIPISRLELGQGVYCSTYCANHSRGFIPLWYICNTCGTHFKAVGDMSSRFCSKECQINANHSFADGTYLEAMPRLVTPSEDKFDHIINMNMESILKSLKRKGSPLDDIHMNLKLRMQVINKEVKNGTDGYYLNAKERRMIELMKDYDKDD